MKYRPIGNFIIILILPLVFCACGIDQVDLGSYDKNSSDKSKKTDQDELTLTWSGSVNPEHYEKTITVDEERRISISVYLYDSSNKIMDSCSKSGDLSESNYDYIMDFVDDADLLNYKPPVGKDSSYCAGENGYVNLKVDYEDSDGKKNSFETSICSLEKDIDELAEAVDHMADINISKCSEADLDDSTG